MPSVAFQLCLLWLRRALLLLCALVSALAIVGWNVGYRVALIPQNQRDELSLSGFVPKPDYPDVFPVILTGAGGNCPGEPLALLQVTGARMASLRVYKIGYVWVGTSANLHLMKASVAEREKVRQEMYKDACQ